MGLFAQTSRRLRPALRGYGLSLPCSYKTIHRIVLLRSFELFEIERETGLFAQTSCRLRFALRDCGLSLPCSYKTIHRIVLLRSFEPL